MCLVVAKCFVVFGITTNLHIPTLNCQPLWLMIHFALDYTVRMGYERSWLQHVLVCLELCCYALYPGIAKFLYLFSSTDQMCLTVRQQV